MTLPLSFTRVKNLPRVIWSNFILTYQLCLFLWSFDFRRGISVLGARWPLAAQTRNIVTVILDQKHKNRYLPELTALPEKGLIGQPGWQAGMWLTGLSWLTVPPRLDWHLPLYGRVGVPLPSKGEEMLTRPKRSYSPIFAVFFWSGNDRWYSYETGEPWVLRLGLSP